MSRFFSIGLTTILMLMNIVGPSQPALAMDQSNTESTPVMEQLPGEDGSDVILVEDPVVEDSPAEADPMEEAQQELISEDTPDETANSPPADENTLVENETLADEPDAPAAVDTTDATEESDGMIIAPSAVDPNPGDCTVEEICDGGGGDSTEIVLFGVYGGDTLLTNATVEVFSSNGNSLGSQVTGSDGYAEFSLLVGKTYTFSLSAEGYVPLDNLNVTVAAGMGSVEYSLDVVPGSVTFTVIDIVTGLPIEFADVAFTDNPIGDYQTETDQNGVITHGSIEPGTVSFTISHPGYATQVVTVTIVSGQNISLTIQLVPAGDEWPIRVVNAVTGQPVADADIWVISADQANEYAGSTGSNGVFTTPRTADGAYTVTVRHDNYVYLNDFAITKSGTTTAVVSLQPHLTGQLAITVLDSATGDPIANAQVSLVYSFSPVQAVYGETNADGIWTSPVVPGGRHELSVHADGYILQRATVEIVDGVTPFQLSMQPMDYGRFSFNVIDAETRQPLANANITITLRGGSYLIGSGTTDSDGNWTGPTTGWAEYQYTIERHGYKTISNVVFIQGKPFSRNIEMQRGSSHDISVAVTAPGMASGSAMLAQPIAGMNAGLMPAGLFQVAGAPEPLQGANVLLLDPFTGEQLYAGTTGEDGIATINGVFEGRYRMIVSADGMATSRTDINVGDASQFEIELVLAAPEDPGDGDDETPTNPEPGDGDDDTNPGTGDPDTGTNPGTGDPDNGTNPGTDVPGDDTMPDGESDDQLGDDANADSGSTNNASELAQTSSDSNASAASDVSRLPNTGVGTDSHTGPFVLTLAGVFLLLSALGVRRSSR